MEYMVRRRMQSNLSVLSVMGAVCCLLGCVGDFAFTFIIGFFDKGYNPFTQSESYLGTAHSPVAVYMNSWGVFFTVLFVVFAYALRKTLFNKGTWPLLVAWLIAIYGLGEGIGSAFFPYDKIGNELTWSGKLHTLISGIGVGALVVASFILLKIFPKALFPKLHVFIRWVAFSGPMLIFLFLLAHINMVPLKGLWQRLFLLDYYALLITLAVEMFATHSGNPPAAGY